MARAAEAAVVVDRQLRLSANGSGGDLVVWGLLPDGSIEWAEVRGGSPVGGWHVYWGGIDAFTEALVGAGLSS